MKGILIYLLFFGFMAYAQQSVMKPPAVTVDELTELVHQKDSGAVAAYKFRYGKTWFEVTGSGHWIMVTEVYTRLKIYKKAGLEYANAQIMYYSDTRRAKGSFSEAVTYNLVNGAIEKTPLKKDGQFEEEFEEDFIIKKIVMPNVKEGSVIDYKYTIRTPYFAHINDWYFQFDIPADKVWYELFIPIYFKYNIYTTGFVPVNKGIVNLIYNAKTETDERHYHYMAKDVKAIKNEQYVNNIENYTSILKHELASVSFPNVPTQRLSVDWNTLAKYIYNNDRFGKELELKSYFEKDIDPILKAGYTPLQKADSIFTFVRDRMEWNKYSGFFCRKGVEKAYAEKTGNVADINLMLTAMLRYAGLDTNPVLVSTRSHGIALFPTPFAFNYVISSVVIDGNTILMDATSKYSLPGILPQRVLNWNGRLVKKDSESVEVNLMPKANSHATINVMAHIDADGKVTGKLRNLYLEYLGNVLRELFAIIPKDGYVEKLEATQKGTVITNYRLLNDKNPAKVLTEEYDFTNTMLADVLAGKIYFSPMLFLAEKENPFISETRDYPVDFMYPLQKRHIMTITLPDGYKLESLPQPLSIIMKDNIGSFKYNITSTGNQIQLSSILDINYAVVPPEYYQELKDLFRKMLEKQNEKVVLTKA